MHGRLPGFEVFRDDKNNQLVKTVINRYLTKQLGGCFLSKRITTKLLITCQRMSLHPLVRRLP